jgi:hypothetical protein
MYGMSQAYANVLRKIFGVAVLKDVRLKVEGESMSKKSGFGYVLCNNFVSVAGILKVFRFNQWLNYFNEHTFVLLTAL